MGVELLRDHDRVAEHCNRFKEGGRYHSWIRDCTLVDWVVIDCATSLPTGRMYSALEFTSLVLAVLQLAYVSLEHSEPKPWHAVFEHDYSQLLLFDHKRRQLAGPLVLMN